MNKTSIEWTHRPETGGAAGGFTWNPIRARLKGSSPKARSGTFCTRISPGCTHCYASTINKRFGTGAEYTVPNLADHEFFIDQRILEEPAHRKKPATIFVGDMFDLFHEAIPQIMIAQVLWIAIKAKWHTFQFLTKRAQRMLDELKSAEAGFGQRMPAHMWFGVSVEDQPRANERIPFLLQTPAAVRFLSVEPLLDGVNVSAWLAPKDFSLGPTSTNWIHWVICGGESGPGARMFRREWAESLLKQCREAGVPFFMKQFGSYPVLDPRYDQTLPGATRRLRDRKGGDPEEWPEHLRVREFPTPTKGDRAIYLRDEAKVGV